MSLPGCIDADLDGDLAAPGGGHDRLFPGVAVEADELEQFAITEPAELGVRAEPDADDPSLLALFPLFLDPLVPADQLQRLVHAGLVVARVVRHAARVLVRELIRANEVAA